MMLKCDGIMRMLVSFLTLIFPAGVSAAEGKENTLGHYEVAYCTYIGGDQNEQLREVILYDDGSVLVGGQTSSSDLPVTDGVVQPNYGGEAPGRGHPGIYGGDCFLMRLSADGKRILFCTYFGGSRQERNVYGMALDKEGNVVITSATRSPDLPTTQRAFQRQYGGGPSDWMVAKLSPDCQRVLWCTYVGGSGDDFPRGGLALDVHDNVYVVGGTDSADFPTTSGVFQRSLKGTRDAAVVKLTPDGSELVFGTLLGGSGWDGTMGIRVGESGNFHIAGHTQSSDFPVTSRAFQAGLGGKSDCYLAGFTPDARQLLYATYLGGEENEFAEHRLSFSSDGGIFLTGVTASADFPTTPNALGRNLKGRTDGFLTKLSGDRTRYDFSTLLGGSGGEFCLMPTQDEQGNVFLVGHTQSPDYPVTAGAIQDQYAGAGDGTLTMLKGDGTAIVYATYIGGSGDDLIRSLTLGPKGEIYLVGSTTSNDFPVTPGAVQSELKGQSDAFVMKLVPRGRGSASGTSKAYGNGRLKPGRLPRVFCMDPKKLDEALSRTNEGDKSLQPALRKLIADAEEALEAGPFSVMDKTLMPSSGDKHDYMSLGPYWWPDPGKADGLPYIRRDGEVNPETRTKDTDRPAFGEMTSAIEVLAPAWYFTGRERYAVHAALLLRTWFLDPATRMNPNLQFGQAIPGRVEGRDIGIIDTARLTGIIDVIALLESSDAWMAEDHKQMQDWCTAYLRWLRTSDHGRGEDRQHNNHATWYDAQVAGLALFVGEDDLARSVLETVKKRRIDTQIQPDGSQPYELARTKSFGYSVMNLDGFFRLASMAEKVGVDLWNYESGDGRSIRKALDFLAPYADPEKKWPHKQIAPLDCERLFSLLRQGATAYKDTSYDSFAGKIPEEEIIESSTQLFWPR
ncbi:MAG: alginate lyase family protein [Planctomycetota bacterium]